MVGQSSAQAPAHLEDPWDSQDIDCKRNRMTEAFSSPSVYLEDHFLDLSLQENRLWNSKLPNEDLMTLYDQSSKKTYQILTAAVIFHWMFYGGIYSCNIS